jgi:leader peptidase (prepilin peptidase) / N-methyltransferase
MASVLVFGAIAFAFGLAIGSFLNVCILRIPSGKSIVLPASACPKCGTPIKPWDNIPVLSYLILLGRCRSCRVRISPMYPAVEFVTGALFVLCYFEFGISLATIKWCLFAALIVELVVTDFRERILPDVVNFTGLAIGLLFSFFSPPPDGTALWFSSVLFKSMPPRPVISLADALLGAAIGGGVLWVISEGYFRLRGREGMGLGDVKMMLMVGSFLGAKRTILTMLGGSLIGTLYGVIAIARGKGRDYELPFGSFLGVAALIVVLFGTPVVDWYVSLLRMR